MKVSPEVLALKNKMFELVWYARSKPMDDPWWNKEPDDIRKEAWKNQMEVKKKYPGDAKALACPDTGDWQHGFNCGVLAALRYATERNRKFANENWPDLDT